MEFGEKLQELRKRKGLTQEELADALFVSRTAVSKWESGRGYPSIDSLKELSKFFSVTIDDLLSGEKILSIAENENYGNIRRLCNYLFGVADLLAVMLIFLPLYPNPVGDFIYSVNLLNYVDTTIFSRIVYWTTDSLLILLGCLRFALTKLDMAKGQNIVTGVSLGIGAITVLYLGLAREPYAMGFAFVLFLMKAAVLAYSYKKTGKSESVIR